MSSDSKKKTGEKTHIVVQLLIINTLSLAHRLKNLISHRHGLLKYTIYIKYVYIIILLYIYKLYTLLDENPENFSTVTPTYLYSVLRIINFTLIINR